MKLTVGFINGTKTDFIVDKFDYDEYENVLKLKKKWENGGFNIRQSDDLLV